MISTSVSRASAAVQLLGGLGLLFAPDVILPALAPGFPPAAAWVGQLVAAAWLGVASLNWLQRGTVLGGIYGRPVVFANLTLYAVSALSLARAALAPGGGTGLRGLLALAATLAVVYAALLLRGPFDAGEGAAG